MRARKSIINIVSRLRTLKMKAESEVISKCTIKPSSPTPHHLKCYQLSFLDQINPPVFMPLIIFYPPDSNLSNTDRSNQLKKSLSEALARFYPLSGRIIDNTYINCNDEGVPYVEALVNCKLSEVLDNPIPREFNKFLPCDLDDVKDLGLVVQVTFFDACGGMALGVGISHKIADASSLLLFVKSWAAISRGDADYIPAPKFETASLFPPRDLAGFNHTSGMVKKNDIATKRFVFTASKIADLQEKYTNSATGEYHIKPTRIEALSAFIWTRFMAATRGRDDCDRIYTLTHAANLRTRIDPPLPDSYFGNISRPATTVPSLDNGCGIVSKMRDALRNLRGEYVSTNLQEGDKHLNFLKERVEQVKKGEVVNFNFTSLCRFPLYEADFGWGKPARVGSASLTFKNLVVFMDAQPGDGIEAWINLKLEDMPKLESDEELLSYVSSCSLDSN